MLPDYLKLPENTSQKIWGTLKRKDKLWHVEGHPYMVSMAKRLFPGSKGSSRSHGTATFPATKRVVGDLNWFMHRFPLDIKDIADWQKELETAQEHFQKQENILKSPTKITPSPKFKGTLLEFQKEGLAFLLHNPRALLADEMGLGKANWIESFVFTPDGKKKIKDIKVGNEVIGSDGKPTVVKGVYPQGIKKLYKVTFNDGSSTLITENHVWAVNNRNNYRGEPHILLTTEQMMDENGFKIHKGHGCNKNKDYQIKTYYKEPSGNNKWQIPMVKPINFEKNNLPLDPYAMGCLLGDGSFAQKTIIFSTADKEILDVLNELLPTDIEIVKKSGSEYDYSLRRNNPRKYNSLTRIIESYALMGKKSLNKFIPDDYKYASVSERLSLLQGLMDTDGCPIPDGYGTEYCTVSKQLALDIQELVETLGGSARLKIKKKPKYIYKGIKKTGKTAYRLNIKLPNGFCPFRLTRKKEIYITPTKYQVSRYIKDITYEKDGEAVCIRVANPDGLYVTDHCIVTHNTPTALSWLVSLKCGPPYIIVVPPHLLRQWKSEIYKFLGENTSVHTITGLKPYDLPLAHIYLIHYLVLRGWKNYLPEFGFNACVFDEIQELRRNESEKYNGASLLAEATDNVIGLSGTPVYNMGFEIYNILNILEYHCLGDPFSFRREWCNGDYSTYISRPAILGDFLKEEGLMLRRRKEEVLSELPPKRRLVQNIDVDTGIFDNMIASVVENAKEIPEIKDAFERGRSLREAINETRMITGIAKAHYVCAFVKTLLEAGEPVVLYAHHHKVMDVYMDELKEYYPVMISGRQTGKVKDLAQKAFMAGDTDLIMVSLRSATGLNLQRARCAVFGELDWSPAVHSQSEDRLHRIGQKDSVLCYYLVCPAGTDMNMQETLGLKASQFVNIMGDRPETEDDKLMAQVDVKKHMKTVLTLLQEGGRKKEISEEAKEGLRKLEKMPKAKEPTSIDDFYSNF